MNTVEKLSCGLQSKCDLLISVFRNPYILFFLLASQSHAYVMSNFSQGPVDVNAI